MNITDEQKTSIAGWIKDGKSLADVQKLLREEFSLPLTYMDVRFLVDDLDISFAEPEVTVDDEGEEAKVVEPEVVDEAGVTIDVDTIVLPGALVSGTVKFSDGVSLGWQLTSTGQLGLIPGDDPNYRPSPEDVESFQTQLEEVLKKKGF